MRIINGIRKFFLNPIHITHKKYEALRALFIDQLDAKAVAEKFGYSIHTINAMRRDFLKALREKKIKADCFFLTYRPGRHADETKARAKEKIIRLRKQNYSILDIKSVLQTEGYAISHDYIHRVLTAEGFARLPRRTHIERKRASSKIITAPKSRPIE